MTPIRQAQISPDAPTRTFAVPSFALSTELGELFRSGRGIHAVLFAFAGFLGRSYGATRCIIDRLADDGPRQYTSEPDDAARHAQGRPPDPEVAELSALLQPNIAMLHPMPRSRGKPAPGLFDATLLNRYPAADARRLSKLAECLGAGSVMSVSLRSRNETLGRIYVISAGRGYRFSDLRTLVRLAREAGPSIENMVLIERLSRAAARQEGRRISRDLHDGTIQSFIGLKLGLEALRRKLPAGNGAACDLDELVAIANDGITHLRHYVGRLKRGADLSRACRLLPALRQQAERFTQYYGVATSVVGPEDLEICARVHDEILYMVREALSNVRRHTRARRATIAVSALQGRLELEVLNDRAARAADWQDFQPDSIAERARDLGGAVRVERRDGRHTAVVVGVPL